MKLESNITKTARAHMSCILHATAIGVQFFDYILKLQNTYLHERSSVTTWSRMK